VKAVPLPTADPPKPEADPIGDARANARMGSNSEWACLEANA